MVMLCCVVRYHVVLYHAVYMLCSDVKCECDCNVDCQSDDGHNRSISWMGIGSNLVGLKVQFLLAQGSPSFVLSLVSSDLM